MIKTLRKDAPKPLSLLVRRRRARAVKMAALILAVPVIILVGGVASNFSSINIANVEIEGTSVISEDVLNDEISEELAGRYFGLFSKSNILLYPREKLSAKLQSVFQRIKSVDIHIKNLTTVILSVEERKPAGFWCGSRGNDPLFSKDCYFLDESGFIFAPAPDFFGTTYLKFYGGVEGDPVGKNFLAPEIFSQVNLFLGKLSELQVKPMEFAVSSDGNYEIFISGGGRIIVNPEKDLAVALENLKILLTQSELSKKEDFPLALDYIDLRYGNKIYYKLKAESAK